MSNIGFPEFAVTMMTALILALTVVPAVRICGKAGFPRWLGVLAIVPLANVCLAFFLAFARWPLERELAEAKRLGGASSTANGG